MTNDPLGFIDSPEPKTPEPVTSEPAQATGEQTRDAQGRFAAQAPKEPVAPAATAQDPAMQAAPPAPATPAPVAPQEHTVPLPKYLDSYNEARELKRENERLRREAQARTAPPPQLPDPIQDPDGYREAILGEARKGWGEELNGMRLQMSEQMARQVYGDEKVGIAFKAFEEAIAAGDAHSYHRVMNSQHPAAEIVKWHQQKQLLDKIGTETDLDAFVRKRWAELNAAPQNPAAAPGQPPPPQAAPVVAPPASLSRAPAGQRPGDVPVGPGQAFDQVFAR